MDNTGGHDHSDEDEWWLEDYYRPPEAPSEEDVPSDLAFAADEEDRQTQQWFTNVEAEEDLAEEVDRVEMEGIARDLEVEAAGLEVGRFEGDDVNRDYSTMCAGLYETPSNPVNDAHGRPRTPTDAEEQSITPPSPLTPLPVTSFSGTMSQSPSPVRGGTGHGLVLHYHTDPSRAGVLRERIASAHSPSGPMALVARAPPLRPAATSDWRPPVPQPPARPVRAQPLGLTLSARPRDSSAAAQPGFGSTAAGGSARPMPSDNMRLESRLGRSSDVGPFAANRRMRAED